VRELADPEEVPVDPVLRCFALKPREVW
jgi:hypothetical protein